MSTLLELANTGRDVKVGDNTIKVFGISTETLISIITKYPAVTKAMSGVDVEGGDLMKIAPDAVAEIIVAGTGNSRDNKHLEAARRVPVEFQLDILTAILKQTFPSGVGPFVEKLVALGVLAKVPEPKPDANLSSPSSPAQPTS